MKNTKNFIVDGHCDSLVKAYDEKIELDNTKLMFDFNKVNYYKPYIQFLATYINTKYVTQNYDNGYIRGNSILDKFDEQYNKYKQDYDLLKVTNQLELKQTLENNKVGIILSSENGAIIGTNIENIQNLYKRGIRVMGITWNDDNLLGSGAMTKNDIGITSFGKECVKKMNQLGIIVDVSHTSYKTFFDIADISENIIATHSNSYFLCNHERNLRDEQIKIIASKGGVIGVCFYDCFLNSKNKATSDDIVNHIEYIVNLVGIDYVGLGSDFDGIKESETPADIKNVNDMNIIIEKLKERGFSSSDINKIMGLNYIRVLKKNL